MLSAANAAWCPGIFFFDSYLPKLKIGTTSAGETTYWHTDVIYLLCAFLCLLVSLWWITAR